MSGESAELDDLLEGLQDAEDPVRRMVAARDLGRLGGTAQAATPFLVEGLGDVEPMVRAMCAAALGKVGASPALAVPALVAALEEPAAPALFWVLDALGRMGSHATAALPAIEARGDHAHEAVRNAARLAARRIRSAGRGHREEGPVTGAD